MILSPIETLGIIPILFPQAHYTFIWVYFHRGKCRGGRGRRSAIVQTSWDCRPDLRGVIWVLLTCQTCGSFLFDCSCFPGLGFKSWVCLEWHTTITLELFLRHTLCVPNMYLHSLYSCNSSVALLHSWKYALNNRENSTVSSTVQLGTYKSFQNRLVSISLVIILTWLKKKQLDQVQ